MLEIFVGSANYLSKIGKFSSDLDKGDWIREVQLHINFY